MPEITSMTEDLPVDWSPGICQYDVDLSVAATHTEHDALRQRDLLPVKPKLLKLAYNLQSLDNVGAERSDLVMDGSVILWRA